jgi:hypothetical protein
MQDGSRSRGEEGTGGDDSRPQRPGEGGTTRFGMEDGDNTDSPATGRPSADEEEGSR